ncbi:MAG: LTA synthase family protein [Clostridiales Family XIII bacterium]|jgi:phosphoglycerol transferase MdoB-like AlkP superfamily enzyme|nr:LTA synthase family protein [Clostridiales Family XIII bacterium]
MRTGKNKADKRYVAGTVCAAALVGLKLLLFYAFIGVKPYFAAVWFLTCLFTCLFFSVFHNKWIPAAVYFVLSLIMFADVTYNSFFNHYLSVNMLGAVGMLDDIGASILEVLRPSFFLIPLDAVAILCMLAIWRVVQNREDFADWILSETIGAEDGRGENTVSAGAVGAETGQDADTAFSDAVNADSNFISGFSLYDDLHDTALDEYYTEVRLLTGRSEKKKRLRERRRKLPVKLFTQLARLGRINYGIAIVIVLCVLIGNPFGSNLITSLSNQEIYAYHLGDALFRGERDGMASRPDAMELILADNYSDEKNGPLFGVAQGRNLIVIQLESFQNFVVGLNYNEQEITPNLNRLIEDNTVYFDQFFHQVGAGNTSDAEFAINNSICGSSRYFTYKLFSNNTFRGLPVLLKEKGYSTAVFHAYEDILFWNRAEMYPAEGFDLFYGGLDDHRMGDYHLTEWMGWGLPDSEFYKQTLPFMEKLPQPFYSFVISLSNHHPFEMLDHYQFIDLLPEDEGTLVGNYLQSAAYTDWSLGIFLDGLKNAGLYYNSLIAIYGDHQGLTQEGDTPIHMERLLGKPYDFDVMMNIPLIISMPDIESASEDLRTTASAVSASALALRPAVDIRGTVHTVGGQIDFLPTAAYLLGIEDLAVHFGHNLLTADKGFVAVQTYMPRGSFITDDTLFEMSRDGAFDYSRVTDRRTREPVSVFSHIEEHERSLNIQFASELVLDEDMIMSGTNSAAASFGEDGAFTGEANAE